MTSIIKGLKAKALKSKRWLQEAKLTYENLLKAHAQILTQLADTKQEEEIIRLKEEVNALDAALEGRAKNSKQRNDAK